MYIHRDNESGREDEREYFFYIIFEYSKKQHQKEFVSCFILIFLTIPHTQNEKVIYRFFSCQICGISGVGEIGLIDGWM